MTPKRYFLAAAFSSIFLFSCSVFVFLAAFDRRFGAMGTAAIIVAQIVAQAVCFGVAPYVAIFAAFAFERKSLRRANYPRIEHLRIAGKYQAAGSRAEMGFSPLHLRG